ncbi:MAG: YeaH/YhbH family protein, partial [Aquabacterium sp.]|nr:YeaH/YhbH family protein [Aquabacterium sp.]
HRAGFVSDGTPSNLSVVRSMRGAIGRRLAIGAGSRGELRALEEELELVLTQPVTAMREAQREDLEARIGVLKNRLSRIPYLDPIDLRYRSRVKTPVPTSKAVMFCLMDVSGSMDEGRKDLSKRFFILLYLFLTRHYEKIDIVFVRHHTQAQEVDEENFFHARETGGTVVSSALVLMEEIIKARYAPTEWNIYGAQASDGDNWHHDSGRCRELLAEKILPLCRYFAYVQVAEEEQNLWEEYTHLTESCRHFAMRKAVETSQIYPVFRDLFKKEGMK